MPRDSSERDWRGPRVDVGIAAKRLVIVDKTGCIVVSGVLYGLPDQLKN